MMETKIKVQQRRPAYFTGFEDEENFISTLEELKEIDWIKNFSTSPGFYGYFNSKSKQECHPDILMALYNYEEKFGGCKSWWAVGYIFGDGESLGLKEYSEYIGDHLSGCPCGKHQHNECTCGFKNK